MSDRYITRRGGPDDGEKLKQLFDAVFHPDDVGTLAQVIFDHLPRMEPKNWFIAEEEASGQMVAGFALIPWRLELEGVPLKVAEMGIVGTLEEHRKQGLMRRLNAEFDQALEEGGFDLSIIQGIPGFYSHFGFHYALPLENHINVPLHAVAEKEDDARKAWSFRLADPGDIPFLLQEDETYRGSFSISTLRDEENWRYLLTEGSKTVYGSEFWIMEEKEGEGRFYFRIPRDGFGKGLITSEISDGIHYEALEHLLLFCKGKAVERDKPYVRLNLHNESAAGRMAIGMGAEVGRSYAWQIKLPSIVRYLKKIGPVLERRMEGSVIAGHSGTLRLYFYRQSVDLVFDCGSLVQVRPGEGECGDTFCIAAEMFPALCLGHRSWREIRHIKPDVYPSSGKSGLLVETLFPSAVSWIHEQY